MANGNIGHWRQRGNNSFELIYKGNSTTVQLKNDKENKAVTKALAKFVITVDEGKFKPPSKITLKEFSKQWIRDYVERELAPITQKTYKDKLEERILPILGKSKLDNIKPKHILDLYANLQEDGMRKDGKAGGMGIDSIQQVHKVLSSIFKWAVEWEITENNPMKKVRAPRKPPKEPFSLDEKQSAFVLQALAKEPLKYQVMSSISILTGLRRGELLGLRWSVIDFKAKTLRVEQSSQHVTGVGVFQKDPKTKASIRPVPLPDSIFSLLEALKAEQDKRKNKCGDKWVETIEVKGKKVNNDLLFTQWNGKPMHPNSVDTWFKKFKDDNNLPDELTFHGLRHTAATMMIVKGIDIGTVSKILGHSRPSITTDVYFGALDSVKREAADKMDSILGSNITLGDPKERKNRRKRELASK